jgi:hypothetical protein
VLEFDRVPGFSGKSSPFQFGLPSLICDFEELYRYLVDDFVIQYCRSVKGRNFALKTEDYFGRKGKRQLPRAPELI